VQALSRNNTGFTLIEIMLVIAIIGVSMAVVMGNPLSENDEQQLISAMKDVHLSVKNAQNQAILRDEEVLLRFDLSKNHISVETLPLNDIEFYNENKLDERRDYFLSNFGEVLRDWPVNEKIRLVGLYRDDEVLENQVVVILFRPDGSSESFRVKMEVVGSKKVRALEIRGLLGSILEIDALDEFEKEWDDIENGKHPPVIDFDDFFENGFPAAPAQEEAKP
jgi:prepilin-type N-terminal cleavage/methylation domain-containing protein